VKHFRHATLISLLLTSTQPALANISTIERNTLIELYQSTDGDNWHNKTGWSNPTTNECSWFGVSCDATNTTVTGLQLSANNLSGQLPASIVNLSNLTSINFDYNAVYSNSLIVNDFINNLSLINYINSQTLHATGISFTSITSNSMQVNWDAVDYLSNEGGYRIYLAQQIDSTDGSTTTDYIKLADDIIGKTNTTSTLNDLVPCRQYFVKIISYTDPHASSINPVESDWVYAPATGTIPGFDDSCTIIGSAYDDTFNINQNPNTQNVVSISISETGERIYNLTGTAALHIDGYEGQDTLAVLGDGDNTWTLSSANGGIVNTNIMTNIEIIIGGSGLDTLIALNTPNEWVITESGEGILNDSLSFYNFDNLTGGSDIDNFTILATGSISGSINGGTGNDVITIGSAISPLTTDCTSTNNVTISANDFSTTSPTCTITGSANLLIADPLSLEIPVFQVDIGPPSQEAIDNLLTMDGFILPTEDGNTCTITDRKCISDDNSVYIFSNGKLIKEEVSGGSLNGISLIFLMVYFGIFNNRKIKII